MIFSKFERLMAKRYLRAKRKEGFISVITGFAFTGIALGVATLIIVMSVMNGFREELLSRILGINGHIGIVSSIGMPFNNYQQAAKEIAEFDNVKTVIPMIENQLLVSAGKAAEGAMIRGISKDDLLKKDILRDSIKNINPEDFGGNNVIVGVRLANKMGIVPGDEITLISPNGKVTAFGTVPRMKSYKVLGTFEVGMFEYDSNFIFMPLEAAQVYFGLPGAVTNIDVTLDDDKMVKPVRKAIEESIGDDRVAVDDPIPPERVELGLVTQSVTVHVRKCRVIRILVAVDVHDHEGGGGHRFFRDPIVLREQTHKRRLARAHLPLQTHDIPPAQDRCEIVRDHAGVFETWCNPGQFDGHALFFARRAKTSVFTTASACGSIHRSRQSDPRGCPRCLGPRRARGTRFPSSSAGTGR